MNFGSKFSSFNFIKPDKDFRHHSITLYVNLTDDNHCSFHLNISGKINKYQISRSIIDDAFITKISEIITKCFVEEEFRDSTKFLEYQRILSEITDDLFPRDLRKDILELKGSYKYLVVSDDTMPMNLPYPIFFFPDPTFSNGISSHGFFLSEAYTIIRTAIPRNNDCSVNNVFTLSTDDLSGSIQEEQIIQKFFNDKGINIESINCVDDFINILKQDKGELFHFCCHGSEDNSILFKKSGSWHELEMNALSLSKFKDGTILILNICNGNLTKYEIQIPRSISDKMLDRNAELVLTTEWPVNDSFAYYLGTSLYNGLIKKQSIAYTLHDIKKDAVTIDEKITALGYTLRGNPNIRLRVS